MGHFESKRPQRAVCSRTEDLYSERRSGTEPPLDDGLELAADLKLNDVEYPGQLKIDSGLAEIHFYPKGYSERAMIHMEDGDKVYSFQIEPFLSTVKVHDGDVAFDN